MWNASQDQNAQKSLTAKLVITDSNGGIHGVMIFDKTFKTPRSRHYEAFHCNYYASAPVDPKPVDALQHWLGSRNVKNLGMGEDL